MENERPGLRSACGVISTALFTVAITSCAGTAPATRSEPPAAAAQAQAQASAPAPAPETSAPVSCPTQVTEIDLVACRAQLPADYGTSAEHPMELGLVGGGGKKLPWGDRLVCPGGGWPQYAGRGSLLFSGKSSSPPSGFPGLASRPGEAPNEVIDGWGIRCPDGKTYTVYNNLYRCGTPCMAQPFDVSPMAAHRAWVDAQKLSREKKHEEAIARAREAVELSPNERYQSRLGTVLFAAGRHDEAIRAFEAALAIAPGDPYHLLHIAMAHQAANRPDRYAAIVEQQLRTVPQDHDLYPELLCRKAFVLEKAKDAEAAPLKARACSLGYKGCCPKT